MKCCDNCFWLNKVPKNNAYGDIENICIKTGMYFTRNDIKKDLDKHEFSSNWTKKHCEYREKTE